MEQTKPGRILVAKFGGSSLASSDRISKAALSVANELKKGSKVVVVVSAMGKSTDQLLEIAKGAIKLEQQTLSDLDDIVSMGERTSARIFCAALKANGVNSRYFDPMDNDWPLITDDTYGNAKPLLNESFERIKRYVSPLLEQRIVPVIPGFIGKTPSGKITTIGRGGSDTTAFILAQALNADEVILVTDVPGIMTGDPKLVRDPRPLKFMPVRSLAGLADSGAKFIHKKALKYKPAEIDVKVLSYEHGRLDAEGTIIRGSLTSEITVDLSFKPMLMITVVGDGVSEEPSILKGIIEEIRKRGIELAGMSADYNSLIFYLPSEGSNDLLDSIHEIVKAHERALAMAVKKDLALIQVRGVGLEETPGIVERVSGPLCRHNINIYGMFTITSSVNVLVEWNDKEKALNLIKNSLKEGEN